MLLHGIMKIGILKSTPTISPTGGVRVQALMWKEGLESLGHICHLINMWEDNDWKSYDIIIVMKVNKYVILYNR